MGVFEQHKDMIVKIDRRLSGMTIKRTDDNRIPFQDVFHITHLPASKYLLESKKIIPQLVQDKSKLNSERIKVIWLSPNTWVDGSLYGNVRLSFDFKTLISDKKFYAVEVMDEYTPNACRILITDKDYDSNPLLESYNPYNEFDGPFYIDSKGLFYYHKDYNIEFMFDDELLLQNARVIDFVKHHRQYCNMNDYGKCKYLDSSIDKAELIFISYLIANDIKLENLNLHLSKGDDDEYWSNQNINKVLNNVFSIFGSNSDFEGNNTLTDIIKIELCKSILELISKEKNRNAIVLSKVFNSKDDFKDTLVNLFGTYFNVERTLLTIY